jgi:hypothetical protein
MSANSEKEFGTEKLMSKAFFRNFLEADKSVFACIPMMVHSRIVAEELFQKTASLRCGRHSTSFQRLQVSFRHTIPALSSGCFRMANQASERS